MLALIATTTVPTVIKTGLAAGLNNMPLLCNAPAANCVIPLYCNLLSKSGSLSFCDK